MITIGLTACDREFEPGHGCGVAGAPASCGMNCMADGDCGTGTYCAPDHTCIADCLPGGDQCKAGDTCNPVNGHCVNVTDGVRMLHRWLRAPAAAAVGAAAIPQAAASAASSGETASAAPTCRTRRRARPSGRSVWAR